MGTLSTAHWNDDDRDEWDAALREAFESSDRSGERVDRLVALVSDGIQAQRVWANIAWEESARIGLGVLLTGFIKRTRVLVSHNGSRHNKPRSAGVRRQDDEGGVYFTQAFWDVVTLDELRAKRHEYMAQIRAYNVNVATVDKLIALCEAGNSATPSAAAKALGTTVDEWLGRESA